MGVSQRREESWPHSRHRQFRKEKSSSSQFIFCLGGNLGQTLLNFCAASPLVLFVLGGVCRQDTRCWHP